MQAPVATVRGLVMRALMKVLRPGCVTAGGSTEVVPPPVRCLGRVAPYVTSNGVHPTGIAMIPLAVSTASFQAVSRCNRANKFSYCHDSRGHCQYSFSQRVDLAVSWSYTGNWPHWCSYANSKRESISSRFNTIGHTAALSRVDFK